MFTREPETGVVRSLQLLDVVALLTDLPAAGLERGQVGTLVEELAPGVYEVEFSDEDGRTYATAAIGANELLPLRYDLAEAAS